MQAQLCLDGNGESQVAAVFLMQHENEESLRYMENPDWSHVKTVMTDKDMTERNVFKSEMPEICLEICLFHALRTRVGKSLWKRWA